MSERQTNQNVDNPATPDIDIDVNAAPEPQQGEPVVEPEGDPGQDADGEQTPNDPSDPGVDDGQGEPNAPDNRQ